MRARWEYKYECPERFNSTEYFCLNTCSIRTDIKFGTADSCLLNCGLYTLRQQK